MAIGDINVFAPHAADDVGRYGQPEADAQGL